MASPLADTIVVVGAAVALGGFAVSLFNSWKAVRWKRAELANSYLKDLFSNEELVFACRALEWDHVRLVVPQRLVPLIPGESATMEHDRAVMQKAMSSVPSVEAVKDDPRLQIYRMVIDSLLSWLGLVDQALARKLFAAADIKEAGHWVGRLLTAPGLTAFSDKHYNGMLGRLSRKFKVPPRSKRGGFGAIAKEKGGSVGG